MGSFVTAVDPADLRRDKLDEFRGELGRIIGRGRKFGITPGDIVALVEQIERDGDDSNP